MATYTTLLPVGTNTGGQPSDTPGFTPVLVERRIDIAKFIAKAGATPAAGDVINIDNIGAGSILKEGGVEILTAVDATTMTVSFGQGTNLFVDTQSAKTVGYCAVGTTGKLVQNILLTSASTLDLTVVALTGTLTSGLIRVFYTVLPVSRRRP